MRQIALILGAFAFAPILAAAQVTVSGTVLDRNDMPIGPAHVHLFEMPEGIGFDPVETIEVAPDGKFTLTVAEPGYYNVAITAVDHQATVTPLILREEDEGEEITMKVRLEPNEFVTAPQTVRIIGDWNDFDFRSADTMTRTKEGKYVYTFETDRNEVHYQILGITTGAAEGRSVNQPGSDAYVYDGGGDYRSIMKVRPGKVSIILDPAALPVQEGGGAMVMFNDFWRNQVFELQMLYDETVKNIVLEARALQQQAAEGVEVAPPDFSHYWQGVAEMAANFMMIPDHDPNVRRYAALTLARAMGQVRDPKVIGAGPERVAMLKETLPFSSPLWVAEPMASMTVAFYGFDPKDFRGQEQAALELHEQSTIPVVKGLALANAALLAKYRGDQAALQERYDELAADYGGLDNQMIEYYLEMLDPNSAVQVGREVPAFSVTLEDGKGTVISNETMRGRYYLIDFWATWCGPCVGEMPQLHAAYERFAGDDFEVLSLSFDSDFAKVTAFQESRYPMPWLHAFVDGGFRSELAQAFEVRGIPKPILVNPEGIIVATEGELRGEHLEQTLEKFLGNGQAMN